MTKTCRWAYMAVVCTAMALAACGGGDTPDAEPLEDNPLYHPADLAEEGPATFVVDFETSKGSFVVEVTRDWSPDGADRFYTLVKNGYYDGVGFFRVIEGFMVQFGLHGDPLVNAQWRAVAIPDDPVLETNARGTVTFATSGPNSRTTQVFINFGDNANLDESGFAPFGRVVEGMDVVDQLYSGYGETPNQGQIRGRGNEYLEAEFPDLDYVVSARLR